MSALPTTVPGVIARLREIDDALPASDGVAIFNRVYLTVTEAVDALLRTGSGFSDPEFMADLDVRFAGLWLAAYDEVAAGQRPVKAWEPLFALRDSRCLPIQFALSGMNTHIEHDLPIAVVATCEATGRSVNDAGVHADYLAVNRVLAQVEAGIRRSFLDEVGQLVDEVAGPATHLVSSWNINRARDIAWVTAETLWALRDLRFLSEAHLGALGRTVGMASRILLTPVG